MEALDATVLERERALQEQIRVLLDDQGDPCAAAAQVRALMFINRFREDINRRLEQLEDIECRTLPYPGSSGTN